MTRLLSIDPGLATGYAIGTYGDDSPYALEQTFTLQDGVYGVAEIVESGDLFDRVDELVLENFIVRPHQPVDPIALEVIGYIKGVAPFRPIMRLRSDKGKKGFFDAILKEHGLWQTGKMVGHKDGRDANDAIIHALSWLCFKKEHRPTIDKYMEPHW